MKNRFVNSLAATIILVLIPFLSFAQGNYENLAIFLIVACLVFLICSIISIISTIKFIRNRTNKSFCFAFIPALLIYCILCYFWSWGLNDGFYILWLLLPLFVMGLLLTYRIKDQSTIIWQYSAMDVIFLNSIWLLIEVSDMPGDSYKIISILTQALSISSNGLLAFLLTKALLEKRNALKKSTIFVKINLFSLLSFALALILSWIRYYSPEQFFSSLISNSGTYVKNLLPYLLVCNLTAFITIKFFSKNAKPDDPSDFLDLE